MPQTRTKSRDVEALISAPLRASTTRGRHALLVGTDPVSARMCRETLERMGFALERVDTGVAAVVAARGRVPDLIVMDFQLSDASAGETIAWLRANQALTSVPIVVLGIGDGSRSAVMEASIMTALGKPVTSASIERAVRSLCG